MGTLALDSVLNKPWRRRGIFAGGIMVCAVLALFPQEYRSAVSLAPSDPGTLGLSGALSQLGAANSVFGNQAAIEMTIRITNSTQVRDQVIKKTDLLKKLNLTRLEAHRWLAWEVESRSLRGGIVEMDIRQRDPALAEEIMDAYIEAVRQRLAVINRDQTDYKRKILTELVEKAGQEFDQVQAEYDNFRLRTRYSDPSTAIGAIGERIPVLQAAIKAKEVELMTARKFATDDNMAVAQILAQISALKQQLAQQQALDPSEQDSVGRVVEQSTIARKLERKLTTAQTLYESYTRYLQGTAVEDMTASANIRLIEPPFVDTRRQYRLSMVILGVLLFLTALAFEFYLARPPLEAREA